MKKGTTKIILALLFYLIGGISCQGSFPEKKDMVERFTFSLNDFKKMCESNGPGLYFNLNIFQIYPYFYVGINNEHVIQMVPDSEAKQNIKENCLNNDSLMVLVHKFIETFQLCLGDNQLDKIREQRLFSDVMDLTCTIRNTYNAIENCYREIARFQFIGCKANFPEDLFLTLPFDRSPEECQKYKRYMHCRRNEITMCNSDQKAALEAEYNKTFYEFYGCGFRKPCKKPSAPRKYTLQSNWALEGQPSTRFNITRVALMAKCVQKGEKLVKGIESSFAAYGTSLINIKLLTAIRLKMLRIKSETTLEIMLRRTCYNDTDLNDAVNSLVNSVGNCVGEEYYANERPKIVAASMIEACQEIKMESYREIIDPACFADDLIMRMRMAMCSNNASNGIYSMLPVPLNYTAKYCSALYKEQDCILNAIKHCKYDLKLMQQSRFNHARKFFNCGQTLYSTTTVFES